MAKISKYFSFSGSSFGIKGDRDGTARVALWNLIHIPLIYTM